MRVQRKIVHLLNNNGLSRDQFRYVPIMHPTHQFDWDKPIYVTDKIDGTTVQQQHNVIYKRKDRFKKGDPRKYTATEKERYILLPLNPLASEWHWIFNACTSYRHIFDQLHSVIYFEAFGPKINARYRDLPVHDIRVFDMSSGEDYFPFKWSLVMCEKLSLPIVGNIQKSFHRGICQLIDELSAATHADPTLTDYELEGWVLRQGEDIAKIRKSDLEKIQW